MHHRILFDRLKNSLSPEWSLTDAEVIKLSQQYGLNDILVINTNRWLDIFTDVLKDPMIWFLIGCSILFALIGKYNQTIILLSATIPLITMDGFLHWRTNNATLPLKNRLTTSTTVVRNDRQVIIPITELVPGDIVILSMGHTIPADGLIVGGVDIKIDESALTGEAMPISKSDINLLKDSKDATDQQWGFAGTKLLTGNMQLRIVYTGAETLYGEIIHSVQTIKHQQTPLQRALGRLVFNLIIAACILCVTLALVRFLQGFGIIDALLSAAILALAALPDEFPVVFTLFLGVGVYRLARKNTLVRRSVSIENIGRVTTICTDKTGTITEGKLSLNSAIMAREISEADIIKIAAYASRIHSGDPIDIAIHSKKQYLNIEVQEPLQTFPFTEERLQETAVLYDGSKYIYATKGSPEKILSISRLSEQDNKFWQEQINESTAQGFKVLGVARNDKSASSAIHEPAENYDFLGILLFTDPVRVGVTEALNSCLQSDIHVLMITGDHPQTAKTIAKEIGLGGGNPIVVTASEAEQKAAKATYNYYRTVHVIARAIPTQKLKIVESLQSFSDIVVVTGDGVNDVPALKQADIGIAMGLRGTQSAKEAAKMVLLDDNFNSIVAAISEGRQLFKNLQLSFKYLLLIHIPFILSACIIPLLGFPLLYEPIHIVLIELFIHPTSMLVFQDTPDLTYMSKATIHGNINFFEKKDWIRILTVGVISTIIITLSYFVLLNQNDTVEHARAFAFALLAVASASFTIALTKCKTKIANIVIFFTLLIIFCVIQIPFINSIFDITPLYLHDWLIILFFGFILIAISKF